MPKSVVMSALDTALKQDRQLHTGTLDNGLRYAVRANKKPKKQIEFRLVLNVGSLQENEKQLGMAHFLEHMAFNGTKNFSQQAITDFFQKQGLEMGYDVNAHTAMDETMYYFRLLNHDEKSIDEALLLLRDWANRINVDRTSFENEKRIVLEETRMRRGVGKRIHSQQRPFTLGEAYRYTPGGKDALIKAFTPDEMEVFYRDWYRPELMAVVVVGDMQPAIMVKKIKSMFADLKNPEDAPQHSLAKMYEHASLKQKTFLDPEMTQAVIRLKQKIAEPFKAQTIGDERKMLMHYLSDAMLNQRLRGLNVAERPYQRANSNRHHFNTQLILQKLTIYVKGDQYQQSLRAVLVELERLRRHGFVASEFDRSKQALMSKLETFYAQHTERTSARYALKYSARVFHPKVHMSDKDEHRLLKQLLAKLRLDEINAMPTPFSEPKNQTLAFIGHTKFAQQIPSETTVNTMLADIRVQQDIHAYQDDVDNGPLIANLAKKGQIISEKFHEKTGITELILSNGAKVLLKPTKIKKTQVLFHAYSKGGLVQSGAKYRVAAHLIDVLDESGLGRFTGVQLEKKMAAKAAYIYPYIALYKEGFRGITTEQDMETLLQLVHLNFSQVRVDDAIFAAVKKSTIQRMTLRQETANWKFQHAIHQQVEPKNDFNREITIADFQQSNAQDLRDVFAERFANAGDFSFQFVGSFSVKKIKPLLEKYLANLPANGQRESYQWVNTKPMDGEYQITVNESLEYKSSVMIQIQGHSSYSRDKKNRFSLLKRVLRKKLNEHLREELGLTYGVRVAYRLDKTGQPYSGFRFNFQCAPENVQKAIQAWKKVIRKLQKKPVDIAGTTSEELVNLDEGFFVTQATLDSIKKSKLARKKKKKSNHYWAKKIYHLHVLDLPANRFPKAKKRLHYTPKAVAHYARKYLKLDNITIAVLNPKVGVKPLPK